MFRYPGRLNHRLLMILIVALPLLTYNQTGTGSTQEATPTAGQLDDQIAAVLPAYRPMIDEVIDDGLTSYTIDVTMDEGAEEGLLTGAVDIVYVNDTGDSIDGVPIRMYANGVDEAMTLTAAAVDGEVVEPELSVSNSVATLPFSIVLAPEDSIELRLDFRLTVPVGNQIHYGILGIDPVNETWALAHWYPQVAGWVEGDGWELAPPSVNGDAIFGTTSTYDVTVHAPEEMQLVTTGVLEDQEIANGVQSSRYVTGPVRDFTIVADEDFISTSVDVDGTTVNSWYLPNEARNGEAVAEFAARSLAYFNELIGPYPYAELDVLSVEVYGALGVEFPQLIYMARDYYTREINLDLPSNLEFTVAHEVLHQWWFAMVGNNQYDYAFIDEGLTNFMSGDLYFRHVYGEALGQQMSERGFRNPYLNGLEAGGELIVDTPTDEFTSGNAYVYAMYYKAAMGFDAIHQEIGDDAFIEAMQDYFVEFRFDVAEPVDLLAAFEEASGQDLDELWSLWFEERVDE